MLLTCPVCDLAAKPTPAADAERAAGTHDDRHHGGRPTAELYTVRGPEEESTGGPDFGGAA